MVGDIISTVYRNPDLEYDVDTERLFSNQTHRYSKLIYILLALSTLIFVPLWILLGGVVSHYIPFDVQVPIFIGSVIVTITVIATNFVVPRKICTRNN